MVGRVCNSMLSQAHGTRTCCATETHGLCSDNLRSSSATVRELKTFVGPMVAVRPAVFHCLACETNSTSSVRVQKLRSKVSRIEHSEAKQSQSLSYDLPDVLRSDFKRCVSSRAGVAERVKHLPEVQTHKTRNALWCSRSFQGWHQLRQSAEFPLHSNVGRSAKSQIRVSTLPA